MITISPANDTDITIDRPKPSAFGLPGPPTIRATPRTATAIATHVRRATGSPSAVPNAAARIGAIACMKSTFATEEWFSAVMKEPEEIAISAAIASPPRPVARNASTSAPRSTTVT